MKCPECSLPQRREELYNVMALGKKDLLNDLLPVCLFFFVCGLKCAARSRFIDPDT